MKNTKKITAILLLLALTACAAFTASCDRSGGEVGGDTDGGSESDSGDETDDVKVSDGLVEVIYSPNKEYLSFGAGEGRDIGGSVTLKMFAPTEWICDMVGYYNPPSDGVLTPADRMVIKAIYRVPSDWQLDESVYLGDIVEVSSKSIEWYDVECGKNNAGYDYVMYKNDGGEAFTRLVYLRIDDEYVLKICYNGESATLKEQLMYSLASLTADVTVDMQKVSADDIADDGTVADYISDETNTFSYSYDSCIFDFDYSREENCSTPVTVAMQVPKYLDENGHKLWYRTPNSSPWLMIGLEVGALARVEPDFVLDETVYKPIVNGINEDGTVASYGLNLEGYTPKEGRTDTGCDYVLFEKSEYDGYAAYGYIRLSDEYVVQVNFGGQFTEKEVAVMLNSIHIDD